MTEPTAAAERIREYAVQTIEYVRRAVGVALDFTSDTLPLLDHYLRGVPSNQPATMALVIDTAAAYFGEVIIHRLGGRWETDAAEIVDWKVVLSTGLTFSPAGFVAAAILRSEPDGLDAGLDAPLRLKTHVAQALTRMGPIGEDDYYSLCGRLDTLEHVHEVLVAIASDQLGEVGDVDDDGNEIIDDDDDEVGAGGEPAALEGGKDVVAALAGEIEAVDKLGLGEDDDDDDDGDDEDENGDDEDDEDDDDDDDAAGSPPRDLVN